MILADAYRQAQKVKGEGDARAAAIYAAAYGINPEFFAFYRSLEAYRASLRTRGDVLVPTRPPSSSGTSGRAAAGTPRVARRSSARAASVADTLWAALAPCSSPRA